MAKLKFDWDGIKNKIKEENEKKGFQKDTRFWKPATDEKGNGLAIIRFLPDPEGEIWAKVYSHNFNYMKDGIKKYWIKNCINTFGYECGCPICKKNQELYNSAFDEDKKIASQRKRKLTYTSNVLVIQDKANPENEGKVFLYQYGIKIQEKIQKRITPTDADLEDPDFKSYMPFDFYEGANFKIKIKKQGDYPNYDDSEFSAQSALFNGDDNKIEEVFKQTYNLSEFLQKDKFPTNEETINTLGFLLGMKAISVPSSKNEEVAPGDSFVPESISENSLEDDVPFDGGVEISTTTTEESNSNDNYDEDLAFFDSLK